MSYTTCPHCGANRDNMPDSQKCWRCGRLPTTATAGPTPTAPPPPRPQPNAAVSPSVIGAEPPYISTWLAVTGTLGILLFVLVFFGSILLVLTAEDPAPEADSLSAQDVTVGIPTAFPTNTIAAPTTSAPIETAALPPTTRVDTVSSAPAITDPFAATSAAIETDGGQATLLPMPSPLPTHTPTPMLSPTPINCPGVVLPRLQVGGLAEVVIAGTIRVRTQAGLEGDLVLNIGRGETVNVTGLPICTDGFLWWPIALVDGTSGWVAEGDSGQYFLEPR